MALLKAKQVTALLLPNGGIGLVMVDTKGVIYTMSDIGWQPVSMHEAEPPKEDKQHDSTV